MTGQPRGAAAAVVASAQEFAQEVGEKKRRPEDLDLGDLTARYLRALTVTKPIDLDEVGEFLQLTSRLILLKSEHLLPHETAEMHDEEIEERVRPVVIDRAGIVAGASYLGERYGQESFAPLPHAYTVERPIEPRPVSLLSRTWEQMQKRSGDVVLRVAAPAFVRIEVAVSTIIRNFRSGRTVRLAQLLRHASRQDAVMHFLAVLELVRRRQAKAEQQGLFEDIVVERAEPAEDDLASRAG